LVYWDRDVVWIYMRIYMCGYRLEISGRVGIWLG
jgi:hypothetical protein